MSDPKSDEARAEGQIFASEAVAIVQEIATILADGEVCGKASRYTLFAALHCLQHGMEMELRADYAAMSKPANAPPVDRLIADLKGVGATIHAMLFSMLDEFVPTARSMTVEKLKETLANFKMMKGDDLPRA